MASFEVNLETLISYYDELRLVIDNLDYTKNIKSIINDTTRWEGISQPNKTLISKFIKIDPIPSRTISNALFISSVAGFENFLRCLLTSILTEIEKKETIPSSIINKNVQMSGVVLSYFYSPPSHLKVDYARITQNLATCYAKDTKPKFNEEITGYLKDILDLDNVFRFLKDCEIELSWDHFFRSSELKRILNTTKARETGNQLQITLKKYIDLRNKIAHTGLSSSDMTINLVSETIMFFENIAKFMVTYCQEKLSK
jgi:hypothetical protein